MNNINYYFSFTKETGNLVEQLTTKLQKANETKIKKPKVVFFVIQIDLVFDGKMLIMLSS